MFEQSLEKLDVRRIVGIKSILGIDLTEERVRVVLVRKKGNIFNRYTGRYEALTSFSIDFQPNEPLEHKANRLRELLVQKGIRSKYAVSSLQSTAVKSVTATIPVGTKDLHNWINDNLERMLGLPIAPHEVSYGYEILASSDAGISVQITFARNSEQDRLKNFCQIAGLELVDIGGKDRDAMNALVVSKGDSVKGDLVFVHCSRDWALLNLVHGGKIKISKSVSLGEEEGTPIERSFNGRLKELPPFVFSGDVPERWKKNTMTILNPLGLATEYTLAVGLAVKGFVSDISPLSFSSPQDKVQFEAFVYKSLFQRVTIALGALLILLLMVSSLLNLHYQSQIDQAEQELLSSNASLTEVALLEKRVKELSGQIKGGDGVSMKTNVAGTLRAIAKATPHELWFYKLTASSDGKASYQLNIKGYTTAADKVIDFLKALDQITKDARLIRSGSPLQSENVLPVGNKGQQFTTFEIKATVHR